MDASVSNWVDWVVVASLRNGRERGIRGASEGVKTAVSFPSPGFKSLKAANRHHDETDVRMP